MSADVVKDAPARLLQGINREKEVFALPSHLDYWQASVACGCRTVDSESRECSMNSLSVRSCGFVLPFISRSVAWAVGALRPAKPTNGADLGIFSFN